MVSRFNLSCSGPCFPPVPPSSLCPVSLLLSSAHAFLSAGEPLTGMCADIGGKYRRQCWEASPLPSGAHSPFGRMDIVVVNYNCPLSQVHGVKAHTPGFVELPERPFWCFLLSSSPAPCSGSCSCSPGPDCPGLCQTPEGRQHGHSPKREHSPLDRLTSHRVLTPCRLT